MNEKPKKTVEEGKFLSKNFGNLPTHHECNEQLHSATNKTIINSKKVAKSEHLPLFKARTENGVDDFTSPTSTVSSSRTGSGQFPHGQSAYNSIDSSGYNTSSTLDVGENMETLKSYHSGPSSFVKYDSRRQLLLKTKNVQVHAIHEEKSFSKAPNNMPRADNLLSHPPVHVTARLPDLGMPIPAPRARYPSSHTSSPSSNSFETPCHHSQSGENYPPMFESSKQKLDPLFATQPGKTPSSQPVELTSNDSSHARTPFSSERTFAYEGRCRNPITSFDILPTDNVLLHQRIPNEGRVICDSKLAISLWIFNVFIGKLRLCMLHLQ